MSNISHVYQYGIDESKALIVNQEFLNRYPTEYVFWSCQNHTMDWINEDKEWDKGIEINKFV